MNRLLLQLSSSSSLRLVVRRTTSGSNANGLVTARAISPSSSSLLLQAVAAQKSPSSNNILTSCYYSTTTLCNKIQSNRDGISQAELEEQMNQAIEEAKQEELEKYNPNWKPGYRKKPLSFAHNISDFENEHQPDSWIPRLNRRCGALAIKVGMMPIWDDWGERHACSVLYLDSNVVLKSFTQEKDGYLAVQVGAGHRKKKNVSKPLLGHYKKHGIDCDQRHSTTNPPYIVREFRLTHEEYVLEQGSKIHARHFTPGQNVDVSAISKGKGFQGAMKRWNFSGMPATHGTSRSHRSLGSTGQCQDPGRVFKGKKMAGRMGADRVTTQNLRIVKIDRGRNLIYVKGPVPGQKGNFVEIRDAVKKPLFGTEKVEGEVKFPPLPTFKYEEGIDGSGQAGFDMNMPQQKADPFDPPDDEAA